ncbi:MAG TPA: response regulator [Thermoanaerobaculia bacterium]
MSDPLVLVVDDDLPIRILMQNVLKEFRFQAVTAGSGEEALATARERRPDVVLLDLHMPGMSGEETLAALRSAGLETTPVVLLTGEPVSDRQLASLGAWAAIQKPFDLPHLVDLIRRAATGVKQA